jgi:phosphoglycolate phosphatase
LSAKRIKLLAVDLDGTLVDSAPDIAHCLDRALEAVGLAAPGEERTRLWIGDGLEVLIARALADAVRGGNGTTGDPKRRTDADEHAAALAAFLACYRQNLFVRSRLYPGAIQTLDALRNAGIRLCCITNKRLAFSTELLRQAGADDRFELVLGGDSLAEKKPSPMPLESAARTLGVAPSLAVLVGDSHQDLHAARAAGYGFIWARYGYGNVNEAEAGASPRIEQFAELTNLLSR